MRELEIISPNAQQFVEIDPISGTYSLYAQNLHVRNVRAVLSYSCGEQNYVLDLVRGAKVTGGNRENRRQASEIQVQDNYVRATLNLVYGESEPYFQISVKTELLDETAEVKLQSVSLFKTRFEDTFLSLFGREDCRFWRNWHDIWFPTGSAPLNGPEVEADIKKPQAYHYASLYSTPEQLALTFAYQLPNSWIDGIEYKDSGELVAENIIGSRLYAGQPIQSDSLTVSLGPIFTEALLKMNGEQSTRRKVEETRDHSGWNTWEAYQTKITAADVIENVEELAKHPWLSEQIRYIIIDDGWQQNRTDWIANEKFPEGMEALAEKINSHGFQAGIWTAPFLVAKGSDILANHPDWLIQEGDRPLTLHGETFYLDPTHPEVRAYIYSVYQQLYSWGYRYFKTDFLVEANQYFMPGRPEYRENARCYDSDLGITRGMRAAMQTIRAAIGEDSFWLGCGTDIGSGALLMDASRTGGDIAPFWTRVPNQARSVIHHFHLHGQIFLADPDFTLVKSTDTFHLEYLDVALVSPDAYKVDAWHGGRCFDGDDARTWASLVILSGGLVNLSDRIRGLNEAGFSIIKTALEYAGGNAGVPIDVESPIPRIILREEKSHYLLGLINWDNEDSISLTATETMGIPFPASGVVHEIWSGEDWHLESGALSVDLEAHKSRLFKWNKEILEQSAA